MDLIFISNFQQLIKPDLDNYDSLTQGYLVGSRLVYKMHFASEQTSMAQAGSGKTEPAKAERTHESDTLSDCGYPSWRKIVLLLFL